MDIRIGITNSPREINFESAQTAGEIETIVAAALDSGSSYVTLKDDKGKVYLVPTATIGYVEIGSDASRRVGFVS
ncbi:MAG: DUF3107 domain-containing protein [Burkholderiaceae bacterium]|nr:DUF3107 domain-containing protein [Microbacteriaceae bacterium]